MRSAAELQAEVIRLRRQRTQLRRALSDMLNNQPTDEPEYSEAGEWDKWERTERRARKAMDDTRPERNASDSADKGSG